QRKPHNSGEATSSSLMVNSSEGFLVTGDFYSLEHWSLLSLREWTAQSQVVGAPELPQNQEFTRILAASVAATFLPFSRLRPTQRSFDQTVGLIHRDENLIVVCQAEAAEVHQQAMLVGQGKANLIDRFLALQHRLSHGVEGVLHRFALVPGERGQDGFANLVPAGVKGRAIAAVAPRSLDHGCQQAVAGFRKCGKGIA